MGTHVNSIDKLMHFKWVPTTYAYIMGTHLNCIDTIQMGTHNIYLYKEVDKKYTGCNLKTTELLDCVLIGECVVMRSNTVINQYCPLFSLTCSNLRYQCLR